MRRQRFSPARIIVWTAIIILIAALWVFVALMLAK